MKNPKELLLEQVDNLRKIQLPAGWEVAKLDVEFTRSGQLGEWATVVYDARNGVFYTKSNKCIVYPEDEKVLKEGLAIMRRANEVIKKPSA